MERINGIIETHCRRCGMHNLQGTVNSLPPTFCFCCGGEGAMEYRRRPDLTMEDVGAFHEQMAFHRQWLRRREQETNAPKVSRVSTSPMVPLTVPGHLTRVISDPSEI